MAHRYSISSTSPTLNSMILSDSRAFLPVVQLGTVYSDTRPSGADATLYISVEVRARIDRTTKAHKLGCIVIPLLCRLNSLRVRCCAGVRSQMHDLDLLVRHCHSESLTYDSYNVYHPGKLKRRCRHPPCIVVIQHPSHRSPNYFQRPLLPGSAILTLRRIIEVHQVRNDQQVFREPLQNHYDDRSKEDNEQ